MRPTPTPTRMRLSCNFVNVYTIAYRVQYTFTRVHARNLNGQPREEKSACRSSRRTSRRGLSCVSGSWQTERTRRLPREDPRVEVGKDVRVGVGPMEFKLYNTIWTSNSSRDPARPLASQSELTPYSRFV